LSRRTFLQGAAAVGAGATVAVTAAGCGSADSHLSAVGKPVKGGPKTTPRTDIIYPEGYVGPIASHKGPVTTERATLTVVVPQDVQVGDWSKNEFSKWYEKRTNVHVNFKEVAGSTNSASNELMTKVNAIISSGDLPDVFMLPSPNNFSPSLLELYGRNQKLFIPLNDIIDQYCPETQRMFKEYPDTKQTYSLSDGKIYSMPNINDCFHCKAGNDRAWIYTPWLEKLGLKMPETLDEFEEVLKAFKNKDPNGNGKHDEIPFTVGANTTTFDQFIMGSFLYNPGQDGTTPWLVVDHGKIESVFDKDGWRQGLQYLNKLYKQGLIPKESFTRTNEQVLRLGNAKTPVLGAVRDYYWASFMDIIETGEHPRYKDYTCIPTLKGPNGFRTAAWNYYSPYGIGNFVITRSSKIPEIAGMWADGLYELESIIRNYAGVEGTEWRWARKGEKGINGKQALYSDITVWPPKPNRAWIQNAIMYRSDNFRLGQETDAKHPTFEKLLYEDTKSAYYPLREKQENQLPPLAMSADDAGDIADLQVTITNYVLQSMTKFIQGKPDPNSDSAWNNYLSTLKKMNLSKYLDVNQRAYDDRPK
jgi:putative aldouronate transport system substrate-binding protein